MCTKVIIVCPAGGSNNFSMAPATPSQPLALDFTETCVNLPERFTLQILGAGERTVEAKGLKLIGHGLIAQVSDFVNPEDCVRIDCQNAFLLGEVLGSWREGMTTFAAIEVQQALTRLSELARWNSEP